LLTIVKRYHSFFLVRIVGVFGVHSVEMAAHVFELVSSAPFGVFSLDKRAVTSTKEYQIAFKRNLPLVFV